MPILVNEVEITDDEVHAEMQYHPAESLDAAREAAAQALVIRQLLAQAAREKKLLNTQDAKDGAKVEESIGRLIQQEVSVPEADEDSCRRYYEQNRERFVDQKSGDALPFEAVFGHIQKYLHARSLRAGISQYIKLLSGRARIAGFDLEASDTPLVQ